MANNSLSIAHNILYVIQLDVSMPFFWRKEDDFHVHLRRAPMLESFQNESSSFIFDRVPNNFLPFLF